MFRLTTKLFQSFRALEQPKVASARIFGNEIPGSNPLSLRTGKSILRKLQAGITYNNWYEQLKHPYHYLSRMHYNPLEDPRAITRKERLERFKAAGKERTRKGAGKAATKKRT